MTAPPLEGGGYWLALLQVLVYRDLPPPPPCWALMLGLRTLAEFFFSLGTELSVALWFFVEVVVGVVSSRRRFVTPKVPCLGLLEAVRSDAAFCSFCYSALLAAAPAEPLSLMRGPGVLAKALATLVFVGAK